MCNSSEFSVCYTISLCHNMKIKSLKYTVSQFHLSSWLVKIFQVLYYGSGTSVWSNMDFLLYFIKKKTCVNTCRFTDMSLYEMSYKLQSILKAKVSKTIWPRFFHQTFHLDPLHESLEGFEFLLRFHGVIPIWKF